MALTINRDFICKNINNMGHDADGNITHRLPSDIKYIAVHYTGCADSTARNFAEYTCNGNPGASANYVVGLEGEIYQSVEDLDIAWHVGIGTNPKPGIEYLKPDGVWQADNYRCLGIEMCCRKVNHATLSGYDNDWYFEDATVQSTVELVQELMQKYNIDIEHVIRHYDANTWYKPCPRPYTLDDVNSVYGVSGNQMWIAFKQRVANGSPKPQPTPKQKVTAPWVTYDKKYVARVTAEVIDVHISASDSSDILYDYPKLGAGNLVDVLGQTSSANWSYICIAGKYYGWIKTKYIVDANTNERSLYVQQILKYTVNIKDYVASVTANDVPVVVAPSTAAVKIMSCPMLGKGNLVDVIGTDSDGTWSCVNIVGAKGWVQTKKLKKQ